MGKFVKDKIQSQGIYFPKQPAGQSADCTLNFFQHRHFNAKQQCLSPQGEEKYIWSFYF